MRSKKRPRAFLAAIVLGALAMDITTAVAETVRSLQGIRLHIDNDLFAGADRDRDYTGGAAFTWSGGVAEHRNNFLLRALEKLDVAATGAASGAHFTPGENAHALQIGMVAFTPGNVRSFEPLYDDRPYASLLFLSQGRVRLDADNLAAWTSNLTVGVLGLSLTENLHSAIHDVVGSPEPRGYSSQISAGGEPTARYSLARQYLWIANASSTLDVKASFQASVGFLTETSAALSLRFGRFNTPWWTFAPELSDYIAAPIPVRNSNHSARERYVFAGARVKEREYNVFLQGQFRDSRVRYSSSELNRWLLEGWIGVAAPLFERVQLTYLVRYQSGEIRYRRQVTEELWAGVQLIRLL